MGTRWTPRCEWPDDLVTPQHLDRKGVEGPTPGQARGPRWTRTSRGFHVPADTDRSRVEQRIVEQAVRMPDAGAVTGWAALRMAGGLFFDGRGPDGRTVLPVPLAVPQPFNLAPCADLALMRAAYSPADITDRHGLRCMTPIRALFDEVRRLGELREAVVAMDMALAAALVTLDEVDAFIAANRGRHGIWLFEEARAFATTRSASPPETRMRLVWILDAKLPRPLCNWPIADAHGGYLGRPDLLCPALGVFGECVGKDHRDRARHRSDTGRTEGFLAAGLEGFVIVAGDLDDRGLVVRRMHAAVERAAASVRPRTWMLRSKPAPLWP